MMCAARKWAALKRYAPFVDIVTVDDDLHAGSMLVLIDSRLENAYHGTSVIYIPQCNGKYPSEFFLYPSMREALQDVLAKLAKSTAEAQEQERMKKEEDEAAFTAVLELPDQNWDPTCEPMK